LTGDERQHPAEPALCLDARIGALLEAVQRVLRSRGADALQIPAAAIAEDDGLRSLAFATDLLHRSWQEQRARARRQHEARLHSARRYEALFERAVNGIARVREDGVVEAANPAFCQLANRERAQVEGAPLRTLWSRPERCDRYLEQLRAAARSSADTSLRETLRFEQARAASRPGAVAFVHGRMAPEPDGFELIFEDARALDELRAQAERLQRMSSVRRLVRGISHDLNGNLEVVVGLSAKLLDRLPPDNETWRDLRSIALAGARGARVVEELRRLVEPRASQRKRLEVGALIRHLVEESPIGVALVPGPEGLVVDGERAGLTLALEHIIANARFAAGMGGRVRIGWRAQALESGPGVEVFVDDSGDGFGPEALEQASQPFYSTWPGRAGVGLALVARVLEEHQGELAFERAPEPLGGARVRCVLPLAAATERGAEQAGEAERGHALLVDDDDMVRIVTTELLRVAGYRVTAMADARQAERWLLAADAEGQRPDVLVSDVRMPGRSGPQLVADLLAQGIRLPTVFSTGWVDADVAVGPAAIPHAVLLCKPYQLSELLAALEDARAALAGGDNDGTVGPKPPAGES
jgi:signal transduction histidine kinase/CheY-like chemotaxis protein